MLSRCGGHLQSGGDAAGPLSGPETPLKSMMRLLLLFAALPCAVLATVGPSGLDGSPVNFNTSETGTVTIMPLGGPVSATVSGIPIFGFCVGPNLDGCLTSGLSGAVTITNNQVIFTFFGSSFPATGTFVVQMSGFDVTLTNVTLSSGALASGTFGLTSFTANSMTFTGTVNASGFAAPAGHTIIFNVSSSPSSPSPTPLPSSIIFVITGLACAALYAATRRWTTQRIN